jgi:hypothetical protein
LAYDDEGAYRLIKDGTVESEVQSYLEGAEEMRPTPGGKMKAFPFNPKNADVVQVLGALERKNHVAPGSIAPRSFCPAKSIGRFSIRAT